MRLAMMKAAPTLALATASLLALALPALAGRPAATTDAARSAPAPAQRIEGLWDEQVEQVDCRTAMPLQPIGRGTNLFIPGGALVATNNAPPTVMGITLGQWRHVGGRGARFHVRMRLNLFQPPLGTFVGVREIERDITVSAHGNTLAGTVLAQDYLPDGSRNGNPICARETGTRVPSP